MMRWLAFLLLGLSPAAAFVPPAGQVMDVPDNATLQGTATTAYPQGVYRNDFATGNGAPPLFYRPSTTACSAADNGAQVTSADAKCWIAVLPPGGIDVREWGAKCDGTTNDSAAITAAQNVTANLKYPATNCVIATGPTAFNSQLLVRGGVAAGNLNVNNHWDVYDSSKQPLTQIVETSDLSTSANHPTLGIYHKFGGVGAGSGARLGLWVDLVQDGDIGSPGNPFQTGIFSNVWAKNGANGGQYFAYAGGVVDDLTIVHTGLTGGEIDVALHASGAQIKEGWGIGSVPLGIGGNDAFQGTNYSAGLGIWAGGSCGTGTGAGGSGCAGFTTGISFGRSDSYIGVSKTGTLIQTTQGVGTAGNMQVANGINAGNLTVTGNYENWGNHYILDSGGRISQATPFPSVKLNDTNLAPTTGGLVRLTSTGSGAYAWQVNTAAGADFSTVNNPITLNANGGVFIQIDTVAGLPTCNAGTKFELFQVSDLSAAPTYRQTGLTGGGTVAGLVMCNGTAWEAH